ncbi:MAG TPA: hypothetical protein VGN41_10215 [Streptosporangiaceae bacterium]
MRQTARVALKVLARGAGIAWAAVSWARGGSPVSRTEMARVMAVARR